MAMKLTAGHQGDDVRNDCWVELTPGNASVVIASTVMAIYGQQIESTVRETLGKLGLDGVGAKIMDSGAFDWCIRARIEAAASRLLPNLRPTPEKVQTRTPQSELRNRRTRLYVPGNTPKFFINAVLHGPDAIILDLEDAVPLEEKVDARFLVRHALAGVDFGACERMVRINRGEHQSQDFEFIENSGAETILLPKVESPEEIDALNTKLNVIPLLESARGIGNAMNIAGAKGVVALAIGIEDYMADIGATREGLAFAYSQVVNAARANGIQPLASVWSDIEDLDGLRRETKRLVNLGFEGVGCLHPSQIAPVLRVFQPSEVEIERAKRIVEAFETNGGAISVDGMMVDAPVAARAEVLLDRAKNSLTGWRIA
jgi:citrate lyase subunit beta/citryl-CoA lyase